MTLSYKVDDKNEFTIGYNKRIERVRYEQFNPIAWYGDAYNYFIGNPRLFPQLADNYEIAHTFMDGALITTLNYSRITNLISSYALQQTSDTSKVQFMGPVNLPLMENYGVSSSLYLPVKKWWTNQFFINGY